MINITREKFQILKNSGDIFPVVLEINADELTPINIFYSLRSKNKCLLESSCKVEKEGRYSFIAENPYLKIKSYGKEITVIENGEEFTCNGDVLEKVKERVSLSYNSLELKLPYCGGAIGYVGYDVIRQYEILPDKNLDEINIPEAGLHFYKNFICYDHYRHKLYLIYNANLSKDEDYDSIVSILQKQYKDISENIKHHILPAADENKKVKSNLTKEEFCNNVERAKEYIKAGDIFQVVLSQRLSIETEANPFDVYRRLRSKNPSPYLFYIEFDGYHVVGSSPESLVSVSGNTVTTNPIAGTRPRGMNEEEDNKLRIELMNDEKEKAEHVMLVDLGRNDIGKISDFGTVKVDRFMDVDFYSHVMHIVSTVKGNLKKEYDCFDALKSCLPAGTVSGAPKIRAMEIIDELEKLRRGAYAGALGYFSFNGNMDTCIVIRTIIFKDNTAYIQAGAGIVYDSDPFKEYEETLNKAKAVKEVI